MVYLPAGDSVSDGAVLASSGTWRYALGGEVVAVPVSVPGCGLALTAAPGTVSLAVRWLGWDDPPRSSGASGGLDRRLVPGGVEYRFFDYGLRGSLRAAFDGMSNLAIDSAGSTMESRRRLGFLLRAWLVDAVLSVMRLDRTRSLHASAFSPDGAAPAALVVGESGRGKSSVAAAAHRLGAWWGSDDCVRVEHAASAWRAHPGWPLQRPRRRLAGSGEATRPKAAIPVERRRWRGPVALGGLYHLEPAATDGVFRVSGPAAPSDVASLLAAFHWGAPLSDVAQRRALAAFIARWARADVPRWTVTRPAGWPPERTAKAVMDHFVQEAAA